MLRARVYAECVKPLPRQDLEHILHHTRALWERARGCRIFITGGTGFFGRWLLESLAFCNRRLDLNLAATVLSRDPEAFIRVMPHIAKEDSIRFVCGDIASFPFPDEAFDYILHAATASSGNEAHEPDLPLRMIGGMERILAFAEIAGPRKLLFTSSGAVYGPQPASITHVPESYVGEPETPYGKAKLACEEMCSECAEQFGIRCAVARCFTFVGPHLPLDKHFAIGNFIRDALAGRNIQITGDGTPMRSYLHAADLTVWLWTILLHSSEEKSPVQVYNVGSGEAISIRKLAEEVIAAVNPALGVELEPQQGLVEQLRRLYVPDVSKAELQLGLRPTIALREAIRRTADWHRTIDVAG